MSLVTVPYMRGDLHLVKVECLRNCLLKPGQTPYVMERNPALKNISVANAKALGIDLYRPKKDRRGNKIPNEKALVYPLIAKSLARERIFDPMNAKCNECKRCVTA